MNEREYEAVTVKALAAIRREKMLREGENILVALSGGADSMALLCFLLDQREVLSLGSLTAAHINHGLRGAESLRDEDFVRTQCERLGVPLSVYTADVAGEAAAQGEGLEEAGRRVRYAFLAEQAARLDAHIATAHTLSDSMETVLFHMARGCGLRGLCGIPPVRRIESERTNQTIIRPLIDCTRTDVEMYCAGRAIPFVIDSTNDDTSFARNRIRHHIIPEIMAINAGADMAFLRLINHVREDAMLLDELAEKALSEAMLQDGRDGYSACRLLMLPRALRMRALDAAVRKKTTTCNEKQLIIMEQQLETGGALTLDQRTQARTSQGRFVIFNMDENVSPAKLPEEIVIETGISCMFYGRIYMPRLLTLEEYEKQQKIHKNLLKNSLNYDKIVGKLILRKRLPGDAYHPAGRGVKKTLKKLLGEAKFPAERRDAVAVICDKDGIVLVGGFGCDERVRIDNTTRQVLVLETV